MTRWATSNPAEEIARAIGLYGQAWRGDAVERAGVVNDGFDCSRWGIVERAAGHDHALRTKACSGGEKASALRAEAPARSSSSN